MSDVSRAVALLVAAVLQVGAGAVGGAGLWGEPVGDVANSYPTLLLPGGPAFTIWSVIYLAFLALAGWQALPGQRTRAVHRRTGWWLVGAGVLNALWVALFVNRVIVVAQVVITVLLVCLVVVALRLRSEAGDWRDRLLVHIPVALYLGWVAVATVAGAATTAASFDAAPSTAVAIAALVLTGLAAALLAVRLKGVGQPAAFAAAVCWALAWIAVRTPAAPVQVAALSAAVAVAFAAALRLWQGQRLD